MSEKLTEWEWRALDSTWNLADGHARQSPTADELVTWKRTFSDAPKILHSLQREIEDDFVQNFMRLNNQDEALSLFDRPLLHYSSSITIEAVANLARIGGWQVDLVTPTFDNIADIFKRHNVPLHPLEEDKLLSGRPDQEGDTLFVTLPNNPTGFELPETAWTVLLDNLRKRNSRLIIDASFRLFGSEGYGFLPKLLHDHATDFVVIEDTGKYFATLDLKCGMAWCSDSLRHKLTEITNDILLNVSPLALTLMSRLSKLHMVEPANRPNARCRANNKRVIASLKPLGITNVMRGDSFSVLWAKLPDGASATTFCGGLAENGLVILPGSSFYWHDDLMGADYVRFALMRDEEYLASAMDVFDRHAPHALERAQKPCS